MHDLLNVYNFFLMIGALKVGFQKISGIGVETEPEYIYEGGHQMPYPLQGAKNKPGRITFEKGHGYLNPFKGRMGLQVGMWISDPCSIVIMGNDRKPVRVFGFDGGLIVSWETSALDAQSNELLIDKVVIEHSGIYEMDVS